MPSYKTAFGSFLKTEDLQGKAIRAVIESIAIEEMKTDEGKEKKLVARFHGKEKGLILNRTNCEAIEQITGEEDYDNWVGHQIVLFPTTTKFGNKTVPCLRVRAPQAVAPVPKSAAVKPKPVPVETVPADEVFETEDDDSEIPF